VKKESKKEEDNLREGAVLKNEIQNLLGAGIKVEQEFVDQIPREKSGKFKLIRSDIKLQ